MLLKPATKMIEIKGLKKSYGDRVALKGIDLFIKKGEFYGLLGPNGAGKTTTISIMSSVLTADAGRVPWAVIIWFRILNI